MLKVQWHCCFDRIELDTLANRGIYITWTIITITLGKEVFSTFLTASCSSWPSCSWWTSCRMDWSRTRSVWCRWYIGCSWATFFSSQRGLTVIVTIFAQKNMWGTKSSIVPLSTLVRPMLLRTLSLPSHGIFRGQFFDVNFGLVALSMSFQWWLMVELEIWKSVNAPSQLIFTTITISFLSLAPSHSTLVKALQISSYPMNLKG